MGQSTTNSLKTREQLIKEFIAPGEPFEISVAQVRGYPCKVFTHAQPTLRELYTDNLSDLPFLLYEGEHYTYREAYAKASRIGRLLVDQYGIEKGDRVAISLRNYPEWMLAFQAITSIGGIAVAMNSLWNAEEMEYGLLDSGAKVIFADQERLDRLSACTDALSIKAIAVRPTKDNAGVPILSDLLEQVEDCDMPAVDLGPEDGATIFYTSGSTGHPKGALSSHRGVISTMFAWDLESAVLFALRAQEAAAEPSADEEEVPQSVALLTTPLFHVSASHSIFLMSFQNQRKIVGMYKWDVDKAAKLIEQEKIQIFIAPPAVTGDLVEAAKRGGWDVSSLLVVGGGGAARPSKQVQDIEDEFENAMAASGWGMTETNGLGTGIRGEDYVQRPTSSGQCAQVMELKIVNDVGDSLPSGERGELLIRGASMFDGYWNRPDANAESFVDGWFRTGDVAYIDADGFLYIVDRIKDLIIRGGENIGCGEVEAALASYPTVVEATVYSVPDERLGEEVGATLYASKPIELDQLRGYLEEHIAKFKIPRYVEVSLEPLPRTPSGKLFKRQLQQEAVARLQEAIAALQK